MQSLNAVSSRIGGRKRSNSSSDDEQEVSRARRRRLDKQNEATEFLCKRRDDRQNHIRHPGERRPKNLVELAINRKNNSEDYVKALRELSKDAPTTHQVAQISAAKLRGPHYLGRTISRTDGYKFGSNSRGTNGYTEQDILMPAADTREDQAVHSEITALTQGELQYMLGRHLIWDDSPSDEFLSYSIDPLFLVYHALGRHHRNQADVTIQFLDRRRSHTVDQQPAAFYHAIDLYNIFKAPGWIGWSSIVQGKLLPRKFTQEYLSHGTVVVEDDRFKQARLQDLIDDGLYEIFPSFQVPNDMMRAGLYSGQVKLRTIGYPPPPKQTLDDDRIYAYEDCRNEVPFTEEILTRVRKVTMNFMRDDTPMQGEDIEPHLHIFLCFLTFEKRPKKDAVFLDWIKAHYTAQDVQDLYFDDRGHVEEGYTRVANNLPGVMQYLDLVRDAGYAFGLSDLPANKVEEEDELTGRDYANEDNTLSRNGSLAYPYDEDKQKKTRETDKQKRQAKKAGAGGKVSKQTKRVKVKDVIAGLDDRAEKRQTDERDEADSTTDISEASDEDEEEVEDSEEDERDLWPETKLAKRAKRVSNDDEDDEDEMMQRAIAASHETNAKETRRISAKQDSAQSADNGGEEARNADDEDEMMQRAIAASFDPSQMGGYGGRRVPSREQTPERET